MQPLYYYRMRFMDLSLGRFINRDPFGVWFDMANTGNGLAFAASNPVNRTDPLGAHSVTYSGFKIEGSRQFISDTKKAIKSLRQTSGGKEVLDRIKDSGKKIKIKEGKDPHGKKGGTDPEEEEVPECDLGAGWMDSLPAYKIYTGNSTVYINTRSTGKDKKGNKVGSAYDRSEHMNVLFHERAYHALPLAEQGSSFTLYPESDPRNHLFGRQFSVAGPLPAGQSPLPFPAKGNEPRP